MPLLNCSWKRDGPSGATTSSVFILPHNHRRACKSGFRHAYYILRLEDGNLVGIEFWVELCTVSELKPFSSNSRTKLNACIALACSMPCWDQWQHNSVIGQ